MKTTSKIVAFTLIELLVVIGLIGVLAGGIGIALIRGGDRSAALQSGQSLLASAVSAARGKAILTNRTVALVVDTDPDSTTYMRALRVVGELVSKVPEDTSTIPPTPEIPASGKAISDPIVLPNGIFLLPPSSAFSSKIEFPSSPAWPSDRYSSAFDGEKITINNITGGEFAFIFTITPRGTTGNSGQLILAAGERTQDGIKLTNSNALRGAFLSAYGLITLVNDATSFDK